MVEPSERIPTLYERSSGGSPTSSGVVSALPEKGDEAGTAAPKLSLQLVGRVELYRNHAAVVVRLREVIVASNRADVLVMFVAAFVITIGRSGTVTASTLLKEIPREFCATAQT